MQYSVIIKRQPSGNLPEILVCKLSSDSVDKITKPLNDIINTKLPLLKDKDKLVVIFTKNSE